MTLGRQETTPRRQQGTAASPCGLLNRIGPSTNRLAKQGTIPCLRLLKLRFSVRVLTLAI